MGWLQKEQKPIYKAAIAGLANQRNLRPVFIERKPPAERHAWMKTALARKLGNTIAEHLLQTWLLGAQKNMLCEFLDALGIAHTDEGTVENIPPSPPRLEIVSAVERLLKHHPAETVRIYLELFSAMDEASSWPPLRELLETDPRLQLGA